MNESTIDILLVIIDVVIIALTGVSAGWVWGYGAGFRKATRNEDEVYCILCECGAITSNHFHGCPYAAELGLVTIAKPGGKAVIFNRFYKGD